MSAALEIISWLRGLGLEQYAQAFKENDIDTAIVAELTADDLTGLGVTSIGHRRKLLAAIAALREPSALLASHAEPAGPLSAPESASAERRQLTVMFCDLAGSTALSAGLDPEDMREVIRAYQEACTAVVARHDGFVAKFMGDGLLAYFGYPRAHEDEAERSMRTGLEIIAAVGGLRTPAHERLQVRIGVATGLVVVGDLIGTGAAQEQSVVGETPNLAARMQALAEPDTIVIAESTRRQLGSLFELKSLGPQKLKGFDTPQPAWQVLGESDVTSRFEALRSGASALVGREEELELLLRRWTNVKAGEGSVVLISAEPGVGKSRLTGALQEQISSEPHQLLRYFCSPHHRESSLHPIIGHLERAAGFERGDEPETRRQKLTAFLAGGPVEAELPLFAELLSVPGIERPSALEMTPQRKKEKILDALLRLLEGLARQQPVLMIFEDLHWMDPTSREVLDRTIARIDRLPVLLVATFRPEFQPPWAGLANVSTLALSRLGRREGAALVRQLAGNTALAPDLIEEIIERSDGVPLFLEEVTKAVLESSGSEGGARTAVAAIPGGRTAVPATLQASLMARLDRLGSSVREIAQIGGAIGRDFSYELVAAVAPRGEAETRAALDQLVASGLVFQRGTPPAADYQFKHALIQDTAYGTLLRGPRQALHGRIAAAIEKSMPDWVEREPEILAHHLAEGGQPLRAATYWLEAGRRGAERSANLEAIAFFRRGIDAIASLAETPERMKLELTLQLALGPAMMSTHGFMNALAQAAYQRARDLAERLRDDRALFAAVWGTWLTASQDAQMGYRRELVDELFRVARPIGEPGLLMQAHHSAWATLLMGGEDQKGLSGVAEHVREGLRLYDRKTHGNHALLYGGHDPAVCGMGMQAMTLWLQGYAEQAVTTAQQGLELAEDLSHAPSIAHALWMVGSVQVMRRDPATALPHAERMLGLGRDHKLAQYQAIGAIVRAWSLAQFGKPEESLVELRRSVASYRETARVMLGFFMAWLAEVELRAGHLENAKAVIDEALTSNATLRDEVIWKPTLIRLRGDVHAARGSDGLAEAEQCYAQALQMARGQAALSLELQAAISLARLWHGQGRTGEGRDLLAPIFERFIEGFGTPDLADAKALLDEMA